MKKLVLWILAIAMLLTPLTAFAEPAAEVQSEITVGSTNQISGYFFTDMWGNNTADIDVRALLHGYSTVAFTRDGIYELDETVIQEIALEMDEAGNKTYIFSLNPDLVYNDGTPVRAQDYVFSVLLQAAPEIYELGGIPSGMSQFVGYASYAAGETKEFAGVRLMDDAHFALVVSAEYLPYFYELIYVNVTPYPISVIAPGFTVKDDGDGAYLFYEAPQADGEAEQGDQTAEAASAAQTAETEAGDEAAQPGQEETVSLLEVLKSTVMDPENGYLYNPRVTSGPYQLTSYDAQTHVATFEKNPNYSGNFEGRIPSIEKITYRQVSNATLMDELSEGTVDLVNKVTSGSVINDGLAKTQQEEANLNAVNYLRAGYGFIALSCEYGVTSSENVRKAIAYATDADGFIEEFLGNYGLRVNGCYGFGQWMVSDKLEQLETELNDYAFSVEQAKELLIADGWTLNAQGEDYDAAVGGVRYKEIDGELVPLEIRWAALADSLGCATLKSYTAAYLEEAGFQLEIDEMSFSEMLEYYYRKQDRTYNMFYMASNFDFVFDPYYAFNPDEAYQGARNTSGIDDEELFSLAEALRKTDVGDNESYEEKWYALQARFNEILPTIPLYSNVYFDFYTSDLYNYFTEPYWSWASAILYATFDAEEAAALEAARNAALNVETEGETTEETVEIEG